MKAPVVVITLGVVAALLHTGPGSAAGALPQTGAAVLSVASGFPTPPGAANPLAGRTVVLFRESFGGFLRRKGMFQGPPGAVVRQSPLGVWAEACKMGSPACQQALYEMRPNSVSETRTDAAGRATLPAVPPGTYYLFTVAAHNRQFLVWDLRIDLRPGANSVTLDERNTAPLGADSARATPPGGAGGPPEGTRPCPAGEAGRAARPAGRANSTLSVVGMGYVYTRTTVDARTGQATDSHVVERGNFSDTTLHLLDADAEDVLQSAGIEPGLMGSRLGMLAFLDASLQLEKSPELGALASALGQPGATAEIAAMSRPDFDCATKTIRAHSVAVMTTDAAARGAFPAVPAGTYYLFGRFYRVKKPMRGGGMTWNMKVTLKPGPNLIRLTVDNAALK